MNEYREPGISEYRMENKNQNISDVQKEKTKMMTTKSPAMNFIFLNLVCQIKIKVIFTRFTCARNGKYQKKINKTKQNGETLCKENKRNIFYT